LCPARYAAYCPGGTRYLARPRGLFNLLALDIMLAPTRSASAVAPAEDVSSSSAGDLLLALAVDTLKQGLVLFDETGHVIGVNAAARRSIDLCDDVELTPSSEPPHDRIRIRIRHGAVQLKLERALRACTTPASPGLRLMSLHAMAARDPRQAQALILTVENGQPGLILQLSSIAPSSLPDSPRPHACVLGVLIDRSASPTLEPGMLRDLFGLTDAESRVAEAYLRVDTVKEVGQMLKVSANTVKTHLAAVYLKTGCTRQAQLVRLLMSLSEISDEGSAGSLAQ
jgi:DNA-binding CsgD family transcriptional regulator